MRYLAGARDLQQDFAPAPAPSEPVADLLFVLSADKVRVEHVLFCTSSGTGAYHRQTSSTTPNYLFLGHAQAIIKARQAVVLPCQGKLQTIQDTCDYALQATFPSDTALQLSGVTSTVQFYGSGMPITCCPCIFSASAGVQAHML